MSTQSTRRIEPPVFGLSSFFGLIRVPNLIIIAFTQYIVAIFLIGNGEVLVTISDFRLHLLVIGTLIVASSGYLINDYYDVKIDLINKPDKVIIGQKVKRRPIMFLHLFLSFAAFLTGLFVSVEIGMVNLLSSVILWFYSNQMKRWPLTGNVVVSVMTSLSLFVVGIYYNDYSKLLMVYCFFSLMMSLIRELVKDIEDEEGDKDFGCNTLPIAIGIRATKKVLYLFSAVLVLGVLYFLFRLDSVPVSIYFTMLFFPFGYFIYRLSMADTKKHFSQLSLYAKLIMLSGVLSIIVVSPYL